MSWVRLENSKNYENQRVKWISELKGGGFRVGEADKGIKYYKNKPNRFAGLFRKTIKAEVGFEKKVVYLNKRSAENYIKRHEKTHDVKLKNHSKNEVMTCLTKIFGGGVAEKPEKEPKIKKDKQVKAKEDNPPKVKRSGGFLFPGGKL